MHRSRAPHVSIRRAACSVTAITALAMVGVPACSSDDASRTPSGSSASGGGAEGGGGASGPGGGGGAGADGGSGGAGEVPSDVAACLFVNACQADGGTPLGMQGCLAHAYDTQWHWASSGEYRMAMEAWSCRLAATDCDAVRACDPAPGGFDVDCSAMPGQTLCVGDVWVSCDFDGAATAALDCAASGRACNVDIWAGCGTEPCTFGATPNACDDANPAMLTICAPSGFLEQVDCARENNFVLVHGTEGDIPTTIAGEICGDDPMLGDKGCIGTGPACDFFSQECQGDTLVTCAGGSLAERDCSAQDPDGQSCGFVTEGPFGGGAACGVVESACDPASAQTCEGGTISFCAQGKTQVVPCADAGFEGCATATAGDHTVAYCTP
jgi:hypothetical protein